jgi:hypothetical protein
MNDIANLVSLYLIMLQEVYGYTQSELARELGISQGCLSKVQRRMQGANAEVVIRAYQLSPPLYQRLFNTKGPDSAIVALQNMSVDTVRATLRAMKREARPGS